MPIADVCSLSGAPTDLIDIDLYRPKLLLHSRIDNLDSRCAKMNAGSGLSEFDLESMQDSMHKPLAPHIYLTTVS